MSPSRLEKLRLGCLAAFLPLSLLWEEVSRLRLRFARVRHHSKLPVVSIGNVHSGGTGKTPVVLALAKGLSRRSPAVLSRGYGGSASRAGALVDKTDAQGADKYGDEPWMMASRGQFPVLVDANRCRGAKSLESSVSLPGLILLDDGFQHRALHRDVDLVLLPADRGPKDAFCLPLGDLREPLSGLERASAFLMVGKDETWEAWLATRFPSKPCFTCERESGGFQLDGKIASLAEIPLYAFCGIAVPENFRRDVASLGRLVGFEAFGDHHVYCELEVKKLESRATALAATLVTTEKDWVKLPQAWRRRVAFLRFEVVVPEACFSFIESKLGAP